MIKNNFIPMAIAVAMFVLSYGNLAFAKEYSSGTEIASLQKSRLIIEVRSKCTSEGAVFSIINSGEKWPQPALLKLFNVENKAVISERRLRLANRQQLSFTVSDKINKNKAVAIWLDPQWYVRPFKFDAERDCSGFN